MTSFLVISSPDNSFAVAARVVVLIRYRWVWTQASRPLCSFPRAVGEQLSLRSAHLLDGHRPYSRHCYYRKYRERELRALQLETRLAQAQLDALKMQLHPHFLFNTLNSISVLMSEDVVAARRMLTRMSELLRASLENVGKHEVSLREELDFLGNYLEIEQTRFHDRLAVRMQIEPGVLDARVPNLILQPLVENAIRHGVAPRAQQGLIEISAVREDGMVQLKVRDNGPGLQLSAPESLTKGIGLSNTQARLNQLYGSHHRFELKDAPGGGLEVVIAIPFRNGFAATDHA